MDWSVPFKSPNRPFSRQICLLKVLCPRGEKSLVKSPFFKRKGPCFQTPFKLDRVTFSAPYFIASEGYKIRKKKPKRFLGKGTVETGVTVCPFSRFPIFWVVFARSSFRKGVRVPVGVPGGGVSGRVQGGGGGGFLCKKIREEGKGAGRVESGVGTGKGTGKSMRKLCRNYPLANYPLVSPLIIFPIFGWFSSFSAY